LASGLALLLVRKGVLTKEEVLDLYGALASAKGAKGALYRSGAEAEAGRLLEYLRDRLDERMPDTDSN
jgi:hypothetical protein